MRTTLGICLCSVVLMFLFASRWLTEPPKSWFHTANSKILFTTAQLACLAQFFEVLETHDFFVKWFENASTLSTTGKYFGLQILWELLFRSRRLQHF